MIQSKASTWFMGIAGCIFLSLSPYVVHGAGETEKPEAISTGMNLPEFELNAPVSVTEQQYLGLKNLKSFSLSQVPSKLIVLEIFSVYCPHCRMQAPKLNKLYKLIQQNRDLCNNIKMIGIAAASDQKKIGKWKAALEVPFPLFSDLEATIWEKFGKPGVPYTLLVSNSGKVLSTHSGVTEDIEELFRHVKKIHKQQ